MVQEAREGAATDSGNVKTPSDDSEVTGLRERAVCDRRCNGRISRGGRERWNWLRGRGGGGRKVEMEGGGPSVVVVVVVVVDGRMDQGRENEEAEVCLRRFTGAGWADSTNVLSGKCVCMGR